MTARITTCTLSERSTRLTGDTQAMHRTLKHDIPCRFLWSLPSRRTLVVQHDQPVDWTRIMPGVITRTHTIERVPHITGAPIQWAIIANPTKSIAQGHDRRGKRTPLAEGEWDGWIRRKLDGAINIHTADATHMPVARGNRHTMTVYHRRVLYTGTGTVANAEKLDALRSDGIGAGKAYGCGLLITQPQETHS